MATDKAREIWLAANSRYTKIRDEFRKKKIGHTTYLYALNEYDEASKKYNSTSSKKKATK